MAGLSYVFSASLPAALTVTGIEGIRELNESGPELMRQLRAQIHLVQKTLSTTPLSNYYQPLNTKEYEGSPVLHLRLQSHITTGLDIVGQSKLLQSIVDQVL